MLEYSLHCNYINCFSISTSKPLTKKERLCCYLPTDSILWQGDLVFKKIKKVILLYLSPGNVFILLLKPIYFFLDIKSNISVRLIVDTGYVNLTFNALSPVYSSFPSLPMVKCVDIISSIDGLHDTVHTYARTIFQNLLVSFCTARYGENFRCTSWKVLNFHPSVYADILVTRL